MNKKNTSAWPFINTVEARYDTYIPLRRIIIPVPRLSSQFSLETVYGIATITRPFGTNVDVM